MAKITIEQWEKARVMFEAGKSLNQIAGVTDINRASIGRKANIEGWEKGLNRQLIQDEARVLVEKETLSDTAVSFHNEEVERLTRDAKMINSLSRNNLKGLSEKIKSPSDMTVADHKLAQEAIDKASVTLNVNNRHAAPTQIQQNTQINNDSTRTLDDFYRQD